MGCDIHVHVEIKVNGEWLHYSHPNVDRHYNLFAKMADVRNEDKEIDPISQPKGLPKDITKTTAYDFKRDEPDAHSVSWLSPPEVKKVEDWFDDKHGYKSVGDGTSFSGHFGYLFGNSFGGFIDYPEDNPEGLEDFRIVFWFDN